MRELGPFIAPALALFFILRRGTKPRRIKPNALWTTPIILTVLALLSLSHSGMPAALSLGAYVIAIAGGFAFGWFSTQHAELSLDPATGTITSKPTPLGTLLTAAVFVARFAVEYLVKGTPGGPPMPHIAPQHAASAIWLANAGLLFVAARMVGRAWHMWIRTRPLVAQLDAHRAQVPRQ
jgi:hypothetical protein